MLFNHLRGMILLITFSFCAFHNTLAQTGKLTITFTNIKKQGEVHVALWESEDTFLGSTPFKGQIKEVKGSTVTVVFDQLPYGKYAASTFLDTNGNKKIDPNFMGIPKEPYAFSNNASGAFGPPKYNDASFEINTPTKEISITF